MFASKLTRTALVVASLAAPLAASGAAFADAAHPQTHHCKLADGTMDMKKTHKQCTAAKGSWAKDAAATPAKPGDSTKADPPKAAAPAPTPAPAPKK